MFFTQIGSDISWVRIGWIAAGGGLGAVCRYVLGLWSTKLFGVGFPYGTLCANVLGSFVMGAFFAGVFFGLTPWERHHAFIAEGLLGALTTFSTFSMDTFTAWSEGNVLKAGINLGANVGLSLVAVASGYALVAGRVPFL